MLFAWCGSSLMQHWVCDTPRPHYRRKLSWHTAYSHRVPIWQPTKFEAKNPSGLLWHWSMAQHPCFPGNLTQVWCAGYLEVPASRREGYLPAAVAIQCLFHWINKKAKVQQSCLSLPQPQQAWTACMQLGCDSGVRAEGLQKIGKWCTSPVNLSWHSQLKSTPKGVN